MRHVKLLTCLFIVLTGLTNGWLTIPAHAQNKSLLWEQFNSEITVNADGTFTVQEEQVIDFQAGEFTFGTRQIPIKNFDRIDQWAFSDQAGNSYQQATAGTTPYTFVVDEQVDTYRVRWYFPPVQKQRQSFTLRYTVHNGLRFYDGGDQLWWQAVYAAHPFPVQRGQVRVNVPDTAEIQEWSAYIQNQDARQRATAAVEPDKKTIRFQFDQPLATGEDFTVRVQFTHGVITGTPAAWQIKDDAETARPTENPTKMPAENSSEPSVSDAWIGLGFGALCLTALLALPATLLALWYRVVRSKPIPLVAEYLTEAPDDLTPAEVGVLLGGKVGMPALIATLVDLAQRNVLQITELPASGKDGYDCLYQRIKKDKLKKVELHPHERVLLQSIFGSADKAKLSSIQYTFSGTLAPLQKNVYQSVTERGLFIGDPIALRQRYVTIGKIGLGLAVILALILCLVSLGVGFVPGGLGILAAWAFLRSARRMQARSDLGLEAAGRWQAFQRYLQNIEKYADIPSQQTIWQRWLPYAIVFGCEQAYLRKFAAIDAPTPTWYGGNADQAEGGWEHDSKRGHQSYPSTVYIPTSHSPHDQEQPTPSHHSDQDTSDQRSLGGGLTEMSREMGGGLSRMSAGLASMLNVASSSLTSTSHPSHTSSSHTASSSSSHSTSSSSSWNDSGSGFSGGDSWSSSSSDSSWSSSDSSSSYGSTGIQGVYTPSSRKRPPIGCRQNPFWPLPGRFASVNPLNSC